MSDGSDAPPWEHIKSLFAEALELDPAERGAFLDRQTAGQPALRREIESLLAAHGRSGGLMDSPTLPATSWLDGGPAGAPHTLPAGGPLPGNLGRYRILSLLGAGGMGEVYLAHDPLLERNVALKVLPAELAEHPQRRGRLLREARAAASLNHPNITTIHEVGEADGRDYIAFEHVQGRSLRELILERPLSLQELVDIAVPLADALAYAHERGIIHRDVKTANVMMTTRGLPKLLDFGLAKLVHPGDPPTDPGDAAAAGDARARGLDAAATLSGTIAGTPGAMSPEQALGRTVDHRTDVFSFGSLLYELASGRPAFTGKDARDTMDAVIQREPRPLHELRADLPPEFTAIVARALRKNSDDRYQGIADLAEDLRHVKRTTEIGLLQAAAPPRRRTASRVALAVILMAVAGAAAAGWGAWHSHASAPAAAPVEAPAPGAYTAVMYFESVNDPADSERLGAMLSRLLTTHLSSSAGIPMLSQQRLYEIARKAGQADGRIDRSAASDVARRAGVGTMILGQVAHVGDTLVATAEVVDVATGRTLGSHQARGSSATDIFSMAESLGRQVRGTLRAPAMTASEQQAIGAQLTTSVEAYRAYVHGMEALQRDQAVEAADAFREATELDPAFALAHYRLATSLVWTGHYEEVWPAMQRAMAFKEKLPEDIRLILEVAPTYFVTDDTLSGLPPLLRVLQHDPNNHEALYMVGEIYTHSAILNDAKKAGEMFERLLELDPGLSLVYDHLLTAYLRVGRFDSARVVMSGWEAAAAPGSTIDTLKGTLALWEGRFDEAARLLPDPLGAEILAGRDDEPTVATVLDGSVDDIVASLKDVGGAYRVLALDLRAALLTYHGRFREALQLYDLAATVEGAHSKDGFLSSVRNDARQKAAALHLLEGDRAAADAEIKVTLADQPESYRCLYMAVHVALQAGDTRAAYAPMTALREAVKANLGPTASLYRDAAAAEIALAEGRAGEARDQLTALVASGRLMEDWYAHEDSIGPLLREALARACVAAGDTAGALAALDGLVNAGFERLRQPVPWVRALYSRGILELQAGQPDSGRALLARFLDAWGQADFDLPEVADARARLAAGR